MSDSFEKRQRLQQQKKDLENAKMSKKFLDASTVYTTDASNVSGNYVYPNNFPPTVYPTYPQPSYTVAGHNQAGHNQAVTYFDDIEEIAALLGVEEGGTGIMVTSGNGKQYSLLAIIKAHLELMQQLHILAVHTRRLNP